MNEPLCGGYEEGFEAHLLEGNVLGVTLLYPNVGEGGPQAIEFDQESVRASGGIRVEFDYDRNGYVVRQVEYVQDTFGRLGSMEEASEGGPWVEVGFFPAFREVEGPMNLDPSIR